MMKFRRPVLIPVLMMSVVALWAVIGGGVTVKQAQAMVIAPQVRPVQTESVFIEPLGDVPLMSGMEVDYASALIFDKPEGRFVEIAGSIQGVNAEIVYEYYDQALGQLGWKKTKAGQYARASETLEILYIQDASTQDDGAMVRFVLSPEKK